MQWPCSLTWIATESRKPEGNARAEPFPVSALCPHPGPALRNSCQQRLAIYHVGIYIAYILQYGACAASLAQILGTCHLSRPGSLLAGRPLLVVDAIFAEEWTSYTEGCATLISQRYLARLCHNLSVLARTFSVRNVYTSSSTLAFHSIRGLLASVLADDTVRRCRQPWAGLRPLPQAASTASGVMRTATSACLRPAVHLLHMDVGNIRTCYALQAVRFLTTASQVRDHGDAIRRAMLLRQELQPRRTLRAPAQSRLTPDAERSMLQMLRRWAFCQ